LSLPRLLQILLLLPMFLIIWCGIKNVKPPLPTIIHLEYARQIPTPVAVIGRAPNGTQSVVVKHLVALLAELVRAQDVRHAVYGEEFFDYLRAEGIPCTSRGERKFVALGVGIGPDEVGHGAFVRDFAEPIDDFYLVDTVDGGG